MLTVLATTTLYLNKYLPMAIYVVSVLLCALINEAKELKFGDYKHLDPSLAACMF